LNRWLAGDEEPDLLDGLGLTFFMPPVVPLLEEIVPDSPAQRAGLKAGDIILSTDGVPMTLWEDWVDYVRARPGVPMAVLLERDGLEVETVLTPDSAVSADGEAIGRVGVGVQLPEMPENQRREFHRGPLESLVAGARRTADMAGFTVNSMVKMVQGLISPKNLSGPITIAKVATTSAKSGLESYIGFLALLSISLGVLNLLPIPVLDGGHLMYYSIELVVGKPVPERVQMVGYQIGLLMVVSLMAFALYNDFSRLS